MAEAGGAGVEMLRLETGVVSHAALALYQKAGFPTPRALCRLSSRPTERFHGTTTITLGVGAYGQFGDLLEVH